MNKTDSYFETSTQPSASSSWSYDHSVEALLNLLRGNTCERLSSRQFLSRTNMRSVGVQHFLAWQRGLALLDHSSVTPLTSQILGGKAGPIRPVRPSSSSLQTRRSPPELVRENTATPNEWEAGLSRRHAFRKRNETQQHRKKRSGSSSRRTVPPKRDLFWDASSSSEDNPRTSRRGLTSGSCEHPFRNVVRIVLRQFGPGTGGSDLNPFQGRWNWVGMTCLGLAIGFGCAWLSKEWRLPIR
jgi:hypothetical protein